MTRDEIVDALTGVGRVLDGRGLTGEVYLVGGAAIALAYDTRRSTRDVDAVFEPKIAVYEAADQVARERGLPPGWLNDAVKGFLAGPDPEAASVLDVPGLRAMAASARMLLALKVLAHRVGEDEDDVRLLARELGLTHAEQVLAVAEETFGDRLEPAARFFVEELLGTEAAPRGTQHGASRRMGDA
jgi:hypothetical protein